MSKTYASYYESNAQKGAENRERGHAFERRVVLAQKKKRGVISVTHSAGSLGVIDIITIYADKVVCITCKNNGYIPPSETDALAKFVSKSPDNVQVELHYYKTPRKMAYAVIKKAIV